MKKLLIATTTVLFITFISILNVASNTGANFDELGVQQELTNHGERLDNHEDRITNTEKDVKEVQYKTGVAPSTERVVVREVVTQPAEKKTAQTVSELEPEPEPKIVVTSYEIITLENDEDKDCKWIFSDGTTWVRKYIRVTYNQGTKITSKGECGDILLGREKPASTPEY